MVEHCLTCGGELPGPGSDAAFCPHCGAPQLRLRLDLQTPQADPATGAATTGMRPPPRPQQVDWRMAIRCAAAVAACAGLLCLGALRIPVLTPATMLWILSGSLITLGLYQNRRPTAWMDARIGARIGLVSGICLGLGLAIPIAAAGLVARFGMHRMGGFDAQYNDMLQMFLDQRAKQSAAALPPRALELMHSAEFRGAYVLLSCGFTAVVLLVLSAVSGAFAGFFRTRHRAAA